MAFGCGVVAHCAGLGVRAHKDDSEIVGGGALGEYFREKASRFLPRPADHWDGRKSEPR